MALSDRNALSEWEGTAWAGESVSKALVPLPAGVRLKASLGGPWLTAYQQGDVPISMLNQDPQDKAARLLQAYKVGWFNKAERKISTDFASLKVSLAPEDDQGDNMTTEVESDLLTPWDSLDPIERFLRLMEKPNQYQTGRQLRQKTQIRVDMAGWAFWYTELGSDGMPVEDGIYGISPSRLWPSYDSTGKLIGYVLDKHRQGGGVPFEVEEIIPFSYGSADDDLIYGVGVVEAIWAQIPLTGLMAKHTADVLSMGGRMAGAMWPKNRALDEAEFEDAKRTWRSLASDPNAARRLLIFPEPMEWSAGAMTPTEIGIPELATLNRDDILTSFPISPYQLGVPMPGGLNSAQTRKEDRHDYWEGTIHPRVELFEETIQTYLVPKYEAAVGYTLDFEVEEPNLDDAPAIVEMVSALDALTSAGFDEKEAIAAVGLEHITFVGKPEPLPPPTLAVTEAPKTDIRQSTSIPVEPQAAPAARPPAKSTKVAHVQRQAEAVLDPAVVSARARLARFFDDQRQRVAANLRSSMSSMAKAQREAYILGLPYFELPRTVEEERYRAARETRNTSKFGKDINDHNPIETPPQPTIKSNPDWWDADLEDAELTTTMRGIYAEVGTGGLQAVADNLDRIIYKGITRAVIADLLEYGGERIKAINERTLEALTRQLAEGTRRGYSINQLIDGVPDESFPGLVDIPLDNGTPAFSELRAETIARTETMLSYNRATVTSYGEFGVTTLLAYDGDGDEECADRNGQEFSIDEAQDIEDHPNGTLVWSPVVDKAVHTDPLDLVLEQISMLKAELSAKRSVHRTYVRDDAGHIVEEFENVE